MTTLVNLGAQAYPAGTYTFPITVAAGVTLLEAAMTRLAWPAGPVLTLALSWSDGAAASADVIGGNLLDRHGATLAVQYLTTSKDAGVTQGTVTVTVLQPITTAITVTAT